MLSGVHTPHELKHLLRLNGHPVSFHPFSGRLAFISAAKQSQDAGFGLYPLTNLILLFLLLFLSTSIFTVTMSCGLVPCQVSG